MKKFSSVIKNLHLLRKEWYGIIVKKVRSHISHSFSTFLSLAACLENIPVYLSDVQRWSGLVSSLTRFCVSLFVP